DEPVVAEVGALRLVPGAGGEHCGQLTGLLAAALADVGGPGVGEPRTAELGAGGQDRGQLHLGGGLGIEHGLVHHRVVAAVQGAAGDVAVVDRVVVVARVVVGGDQVDAVGPVGGVPGVAVHVADLRPGEQLAAVAERAAVVGGDQDRGVVVDGAGERVQPALRAQVVQVGVGGAAAVGELGPVEGLLRVPLGGVVRSGGDPPAGEVVRLVLGVHRQVAPVRADPQCGHVVVVGLQVGVQHHHLGVTGGQVVYGELHVPGAVRDAGA